MPDVTLTAVAVDCADPGRLADFWCGLLGYHVTNSGRSTDGTAFVEIGGGPTALIFEQVPEPRSGKNRLHLDVAAEPGAHVDTVAYAMSLGATHTDVGQTGDLPWTVLADPEGNAFCILNRDEPSPVQG